MTERFLKDKKAVITGASQGIGENIARVFAARGADVILGYLGNPERAERVACDILSNHNIRVKAIEADLADLEALRNFMREGIEFLGGIDILVNNAGVDSVHHALELPAECWDKVMDVNLRAPFFCAQEAGQVMRQQFQDNPEKESVIINISSIHDDVPRMGLIHYCSAKAGLKMMTRSLGLEFAEFNTRVLCVSPGAIETDMNREAINQTPGRKCFESWIPMGRIGNTREVAETVAFFASPSASYITCSTIYIDGGYSQNVLKYDDRAI